MTLTGSARVLLLAAVVAPQVSARPQTPVAPPSAFEITSVKVARSDGNFRMTPWGTDRFTATNIRLAVLIAFAFVVDDDKIVGLPGWALSERYDVTARTEGGATLIYPAAAPLLRQLLIDRFTLSAHRENRETDGYALVVARGGPTLKPSSATASQGIATNPDRLRAPSTDIAQFTYTLRRVVGRPVVNDTNVQGLFDITLDYAPEGITGSDKPSVYTAIQEQLGLRLEPRRVTWEHLVVDHVEHPTPD